MRLEHWIYTIPLRLRSLFRRNRLAAELDEELRDHIDRQIGENIARGMRQRRASPRCGLLEIRSPCVTRRTIHGVGAVWNCF